MAEVTTKLDLDRLKSLHSAAKGLRGPEDALKQLWFNSFDAVIARLEGFESILHGLLVYEVQISKGHSHGARDTLWDVIRKAKKIRDGET